MTKEEIKTMTKEERKRQLEWSDPYEFGTVYAEYLLEENQQLKEQLETSERARKEAIEYIKGAGEMATYTKSIALYEEELEELLDILDIDKGE